MKEKIQLYKDCNECGYLGIAKANDKITHTPYKCPNCENGYITINTLNYNCTIAAMAEQINIPLWKAIVLGKFFKKNRNKKSDIGRPCEFDCTQCPADKMGKRLIKKLKKYEN